MKRAAVYVRDMWMHWETEEVERMMRVHGWRDRECAVLSLRLWWGYLGVFLVLVCYQAVLYAVGLNAAADALVDVVVGSLLLNLGMRFGIIWRESEGRKR